MMFYQTKYIHTHTPEICVAYKIPANIDEFIIVVRTLYFDS